LRERRAASVASGGRPHAARRQRAPARRRDRQHARARQAGTDPGDRGDARLDRAIMSVSPPRIPPRPRILVVALRRLGDVLLATPLPRAPRAACPTATLDVLVFADTAGILEGNPDIDRVITMPLQPNFGQSLWLAVRLFKRYHLAVSTQSGDRPTLFALLAGRDHAGPVWPGERAKRRLLGRSVTAGGGVHRVQGVLRLGAAVGLVRARRVGRPG